MSADLDADELDRPIKRTEGDTLEERLTDNAYQNILPARYLRKDSEGDLVEAQEDLFERVAKNVALAEAVFEARRRDVSVSVTPDQLKPDHPRRDELAAEVFGKGTTADADAKTELSVYNVTKFSFETVVPELPEAVRHHVEDTAAEFQEAMERLSFMPNSPTLMNAGDELQQLSACFVDSPEDDIDDIHQTAKEAAQIFQSGGGMGYAFWRLRPYGDPVGSTGGIASGPITFMRTYDQLCETIAQGGARRGAQMGVMRVSHPDVIQFIHAKNKDVSLAHTLKLNDPDDYTHTSFADALEEARELIDDEGKVPKHLRNAVEGHLSNFNISVGVTDRFMAALKNDEAYTFTNPRTGEPHVATEQTKELYEMFDLGEYVEVGEVLSVPADLIWERIVEGAHENGEPGVIYLERVNKQHSFDVEEHPDHRILATNPCVTGDTEVVLADGTTETLATLAEYGSDVHLLCRDTETNEMIVRTGRNPRLTREGAALVSVTTEDGTELTCTRDHEIWTPDGYVEAAALEPGATVVGSASVAIPAGGISETVTERLTVASVSAAGTGDVYNITVDDHHNYLARTAGTDDGTYLSVANCGEQPLEEYEACNLGHINLSTLADPDAPDWRVWAEAHAEDYDDLAGAVDAFLEEAIEVEEFDRRIDLGTRFLENVVTMSDFPVDDIEEKVRAMRKIGLGVMGLAQLYIQLGVKYGSEEANEMARQLMRHINQGSKWASHELALERGSFAEWDNSKFADPTSYPEWFEHHTGLDPAEWADGFPVRNHNTTTIAPTGTTSMVGNTTGGCEPIYNVAYYKNVSDDVQGDEMLVEFDDYFLRVLEENDIDVDEVKREATEQMAANEFDGVESLSTVPDSISELFVTTGDLSAKDHAGVQTACQEGVDSAISKCLEEGTLVQTDSGVRPIESFADETPDPGEFVDVDEDVTIDGVPVESQYYAGEKDATRIRVDNGTELVGATESHKVLTPEGWRALGELEEGDYVIGRHTESHGDGNAKIAFSRDGPAVADGGAALAASGADPSVYEKDVTLPSEMSPRLARFLGMYAADGSATEGRYSIEISSSSERVRDEVRELFEDLFGRYPSVDEDTRRGDRRDPVYGVRLNSKPVWEFVTDLCGSGAYDKEVPSEVLQGSPEEKLAFVNGVTLDGYVTDQSLVVYGGMSEKLADGVAELLRSFAVPKVYVGRKWVDESDAYAHQVHVTNDAQELVTPIEPHKRVETFEQRYRVYVPQDRVDKTEFDSRSGEYYAARSFEHRGHNYMFETTAEDLGITDAPPLYEVTEVEDAGTREMYDIELAGPHEYVVGGVVSHNTVNAPNDSTVADAKEVFEYIYDNGGKGVTYYRDGTRSKQVLTTRAKNKEFADESEAAEVLVEQIEAVFGGIEGFVESDEVQAVLDEEIESILGLADGDDSYAQKRSRPDVLHGVTQRIDTGYGKIYVSINEDPEAERPFELFANIGNSGGFTASFTESLAKTISTALRAGVDPREIAEELQGIRSPKVAWDKGEQIQSIPDAIGTAMRRYLDDEIDKAYPDQATLDESADAEDVNDDAPGNDDAEAAAVEPEPDGGALTADATATAQDTTGGTEADQQALIDAGESPECPDCGSMSLYYSEGCKTCESCGWSEC